MAKRHRLWALLLSIALHATAGALLAGWVPSLPKAAPPVPDHITYLADMAPPEPEPTPDPPEPAANPAPAPQQAAAETPPPSPEPAAPVPRAPAKASKDAPLAPSAEDWAMASTYKLKNGKRYRYNWGLQLRSLMGTAVEGENNGVVRFKVTIAPDGHLAQLDTLWATSPATERLARAAIERMPPLPPTPTGEPLVFERTIAFDPWTDEMPPLYKDDCLPDPPQRGNPYVWDGRSPQTPVVQAAPEPLDPEAYAECLKQLPQDTIEAEAASNQRQLEQWASPKLGRDKP